MLCAGPVPALPFTCASSLTRSVSSTDGKLKEELVEGLEAHLRANQTTLASKPQLEPFYHRTASPVKREPKVPKEPKEAVEKMVNGPESTKSAARRKTAVKDEIEAKYVPPHHILRA